MVIHGKINLQCIYTVWHTLEHSASNIYLISQSAVYVLPLVLFNKISLELTRDSPNETGCSAVAETVTSVWHLLHQCASKCIKLTVRNIQLSQLSFGFFKTIAAPVAVWPRQRYQLFILSQKQDLLKIKPFNNLDRHWVCYALYLLSVVHLCTWWHSL